METLAKYATLASRIRDQAVKLIEVYQRRLDVVEKKLGSSYEPILEKEASKLQEILGILRKAAALATEFESVARMGGGAARIKLMRIAEEAKLLRDRVLYGPVAAPLRVRVVVLMLHENVVRALRELEERLEAERQLV